MIFSSIQYCIFLPIVVFLYWRMKPQHRTPLLLVASYIFYMSWLPVYGILLAFLTLANFFLGAFLGQFQTKSRNARIILGAGIVMNVGFLCYYKYTNFIIQSIAGAFNLAAPLVAVDPVNFPLLNILLPLGISFFVFEFIHYLMEIYRGSKPLKSLTEFGVFAAFFPSQIAGPIKRYQEFIENLRNPEPWSKPLFYEGMTLIVQGLFKKVALADPLGWIASYGYSSTLPLSATDSLIAMVAFPLQIFCDFSGYTDIGRGSALLMGIRLPINFHLPYLQTDVAQYWRNWHMSLSSWIKDYVYIPLGGSRGTYFDTCRNLFVTMVICGLWHGAAWQFPVWGALHGITLIVIKIWNEFLLKHRVLNEFMNLPPTKVFCVAVTFTYVCFWLVLFRAPDWNTCTNVWRGLLNFDMPCFTWDRIEYSGVLVFAAIYIGYWLVSDGIKKVRGIDSLSQALFPAPLRFAAWTAAVLIMIAARPTQATPFIYFQF